MKMLNRSAISVKLRQPFVDWINSLSDSGEEDVTLDDVNQESTSYLIPELEEDDDLENLIAERYLDILENELYSWEEDASLWPEEIDRDLFDDFIRIEPAFMVFDLDEQAPLLAQFLDEADAGDPDD